MKKLSLGVQEFKEFQQNDYIYIDKSESYYNLINTLKYCFLSRPRRFGKSLLFNTLAELFSGNKELFQGLWIYDKIEWQEYPVIQIDLSKTDYKEQGLIPALKSIVQKNASKYNIENIPIGTSKEMLISLIEMLFEKFNNQVVILIDEYDKPIIDYLGKNIDLAEENRDTLKNFYSVIKPMDKYLKFVLLTGVSKFSKVSIFSDLNNLSDLSQDDKYAYLLGYTAAEIENNYGDYLNIIQDKMQISRIEIMQSIKEWYNGYSWNGKDFVYNPYSLLNFLHYESFKNYWFDSGTPTFLVDFIKQNLIDPQELNQSMVTDSFFNKFDLRDIDITSLMFQTGYLTIREKDNNDIYYLDYPNKEVRISFYKHLLEVYNYSNLSKNDTLVVRIMNAFKQKNIEELIQHFKSLFASIPYEIFLKDYEAYYHSILFIALNLIGVYLKAEVQTNKGRIDAVMETDKYVYILEFKIGKAETALQQIKDMKYYEKFQSSGKEIILLGIGFNKGDRNICEYLAE